jgi:hypothetical protein
MIQVESAVKIDVLLIEYFEFGKEKFRIFRFSLASLSLARDSQLYQCQVVHPTGKILQAGRPYGNTDLGEFFND